MSDVGDGVELTFASATGAAVTAQAFPPDGSDAGVNVVPEDPAGSGSYPFRFELTQPGMWRVTFTAAGAVTATEHFWVYARSASEPAPLATVGEVAELWRPLTQSEEALAAALLRVASQMLRARYPDMADRIAAGTLDPGAPGRAAVSMTLRVLHNPGGLRAETVGPFSRSYDVSGAAGLLVITSVEEALMAPPRASAASRVGTIMARPGLAPYSTLVRRVRGW